MFHLENFKLVLGSKSPRRQDLISQITSNYEIRVQDVEEIYGESLDVRLVPEFLSKIKAEALKSTLQKNEVIVCADTVVILENQILGKPGSPDEAKAMLKQLSGKKHEVITGCYLSRLDKDHSFSSRTDVYFKELTPEMIDYYVNEFKPLDKAGSYGIQEWIGMVGIEKIDGCYYNVMGLPLSRLVEELKAF